MYRYNARFYYTGMYGSEQSFDVNVTKFSYGWNLVMSGESQSRKRFTSYPKRVEQTPLTVELVFKNPYEYILFGKYIFGYNNYCTTVSGQPSELKFAFPKINALYGVAIPTLKMSFDNTMRPFNEQDENSGASIAPKAVITMLIRTDMFDTGSLDDSVMHGSEEDLVSPSNVRNGGEGAFRANS